MSDRLGVDVTYGGLFSEVGVKNNCQIEHHRHPSNFLANLLSGLTAYSLDPNKPSIRLSEEERRMLAGGNT